MDTTEKPARTLRLVSRADDYDHTNSAQAYIYVAKQFIPDLNLETETPILPLTQWVRGSSLVFLSFFLCS